MSEKITVDLYGGEGSEAMNVLMQAFTDCAIDDEKPDIYSWLDKIPKTSMVVELVDKIREYGYDIVKIKD